VSLRTLVAPGVRTGIKGVASATDLVLRPPEGITILIYHRVGAGNGGQMDLSPAAFDAQLDWLNRHHRILTLDEALVELRGPASRGPGVVLTFDDGTTDWVDHALPALERHGVPATFYVATSFIDEDRPFPSDGRPLSWAGVRELASSGLATIGSHTHRHLLLDRLPADEVADELDRSIELLGEHAGVVPEHFCYPKAVAGSPGAEQAVRARFSSAVLAGTRPNLAGRSDPYRLWRSPVQPSDGERWFRSKARGGMRLEDDLRRGMNRVRYRKLAS
jgi:peptidoglycan/xylan/chitin deacetylase (PgdA/CDA1 family)